MGGREDEGVVGETTEGFTEGNEDLIVVDVGISIP